MAAMTDGISRDDLIGYAKPLSVIGGVARTKPEYEHDYKTVVQELIRECFTPKVRDFPGAGYPGPGDLLALEDFYSVKVWFEGRTGTLKVLGRGLLFLLPDDDGRTFFIPREEIESMLLRWNRLLNPGVEADLLVTVKNSPRDRTFWRVPRNELPGLCNAIREKGWNIADLEGPDPNRVWTPYGCLPASGSSGHGMKPKGKESPSVAAPAPAPPKKRRRLLKKYFYVAPATAPPNRRRRLVKKYL